MSATIERGPSVASSNRHDELNKDAEQESLADTIRSVASSYEGEEHEDEDEDTLNDVHVDQVHALTQHQTILVLAKFYPSLQLIKSQFFHPRVSRQIGLYCRRVFNDDKKTTKLWD